MAPSEIVVATGVSRSNVQRILRALKTAGYIDHTARGRYMLAARGFALGLSLASPARLGRIAMPVLSQLQREVSETVNLAVLDGTEVLYVARIATEHFLQVHVEVGSRLPAYCTALGRALLAALPSAQARAVLRASELVAHTPNTLVDIDDIERELDRTRRRGYAVIKEELASGLISVACAVIGPEGQVLAAVNVPVPSVRFSEDIVDTIAPRLQEACLRLSQTLAVC